MNSRSDHEQYIQHCLKLAEQGRGKTGMNPIVGACLVSAGVVVAEAWHERYGELHAERALLKRFKAAVQPDDVLYVSLEPCCHHGKTPPCTDIIIESGVQNVVYGMKDPNSEVSGRGISILQEQGVQVVGSVCSELCRRHIRGFVSLQTQKRPYVTLKRAQTRTGEIANSNGSPMAITSAEQNAWSHTQLRAKHDAILVGVGTVVSDDPQLTIRSDDMVRRAHHDTIQPWRIILDPQLRIPRDACVLTDEYADRTIVVIGEHVTERLGDTNAHILRIPVHGSALDLQHLLRMLSTPSDNHPLGKKFIGVSSILVEGGQKTWSLFKEQGIVDEEVVLVK